MKKAWFAVLPALALMSACGVIYTSPTVSDGQNFGGALATDLDVSVQALTFESAKAANLKPYEPPRLPLAMQPGQVRRAGLSALSDSARAVRPATLAAAPAPTAEPVQRPGFIPDRFPPLIEPIPYRIGLSDVLVLSVNTPASLEDLPGLITAQSKRQGYVVQDDGAIAIPDAGRVRVAGLTLQAAQSEIFSALVNAGIDPSFSLEVAEFNSQRVTVGGAVQRPTLVPITLKPLYLHEAVSLAGGAASLDPKTSAVQLIRGDEVYRIGFERFQTDPAARQVVLRDGDSIFVGDAFRRDFARASFDESLALRDQELRVAALRLSERQAAANDLEQRREVLESERRLFLERLRLGAVQQPFAYLTGETRRPLRYALPFEGTATLADILFNQDNQGISIQTADFGEIYVLRSDRDPVAPGGVTAYHLDAENAANLAVAAQLDLRPNDVVFVAEQPITAWNRVISQILPQIFLSAANVATTN